jgi:hypothetical protein
LREEGNIEHSTLNIEVKRVRVNRAERERCRGVEKKL